MTQEEFGRDLGPLLGKPWSRQTVSMAEQGIRAWAAADLLAVALVLHTTVGDLLRPPIGETVVDLGGPYPVPKDALASAIRTLAREDLNLAAIDETLDLLSDSLARSQEDNARAVKAAQDLDTLIRQRLAAGGVVSSPSALPLIVAAIVTSDRGVLVGKRNDGKPPWTFIAGEVEPGERAEDAAVREVKEETGLEVEAGETIGMRVHPHTGRPVRGTEVFVGDRAELAEVRWVSLAEADELLPGMYEPVREHLGRELRDRGEF
jgi:8-oxo-dGTP pyrophosphatase MutT (NUDIX family)